jgi:hypothetical protein
MFLSETVFFNKKHITSFNWECLYKMYTVLSEINNLWIKVILAFFAEPRHIDAAPRRRMRF